MDIYVFASASLENIRIGLARRLWAVAHTDEPYAAARLSRARQMPVGAAGLFYCSSSQVFVAPFRVESRPEDRPIDGVWADRWYLPFSIQPIGDLTHQITLNHAHHTWPVLEGVANATERIQLGPATVFAKTFIPRRNWDLILEQFHVDPEQFEDVFP